jgi:hypothetical protein
MTPEIEERRLAIAELCRQLKAAEQCLLLLARTNPIGSQAVSGAVAWTVSLYCRWINEATELVRADGLISEMREGS